MQKATKPTAAEIRSMIAELRGYIEDDDNDLLETRLAQVAEGALRWATGKTTWRGPLVDVQFIANLLRKELDI